MKDNQIIDFHFLSDVDKMLDEMGGDSHVDLDHFRTAIRERYNYILYSRGFEENFVFAHIMQRMINKEMEEEIAEAIHGHWGKPWPPIAEQIVEEGK